MQYVCTHKHIIHTRTRCEACTLPISCLHVTYPKNVSFLLVPEPSANACLSCSQKQTWFRRVLIHIQIHVHTLVSCLYCHVIQIHQQDIWRTQYKYLAEDVLGSESLAGGSDVSILKPKACLLLVEGIESLCVVVCVCVCVFLGV